MEPKEESRHSASKACRGIPVKSRSSALNSSIEKAGLRFPKAPLLSPDLLKKEDKNPQDEISQREL